MGLRRLTGLLVMTAFGAGVGAVGCFLAEEPTEESNSDVVATEAEASVSAALDSTVRLDVGCTATKVGPRHLLVAARCVADNPTFAAGKPLKFSVRGSKIADPPSEDADGGDPATTKAAAAKRLFTTEVYPTLDQTCSGCHRSGATSAPIYFGADADATYTMFKARGYHEATSIFRKKGTHKGPALDAEQKVAADRWVDAEIAAAAAAKPTLDNVAAAAPTDAAAGESKIEAVTVHPTYAAKCKEKACDFGATAAGDARDIAVIVLDKELTGIPVTPIDLDPVGDGDPVVAIASGCTAFDSTPRGNESVKTIAVPAKSVNHEGSPYKADEAFSIRLASGYVVTPGSGWRAKEARICKSDVGAPLFRAEKGAIIGVTSNFTTWKPQNLTPVTVHHTRVDTASTVGPWLESLGVKTTHSCSTATTGCVKHDYDGGIPMPMVPGDGGPDARAPRDAGDAGKSVTADTDVPIGGEHVSDTEDDSTFAGADAGAKAKKKKATEGCSAAPGSRSGSSEGGALGLAFGVALALAARARRRTS